MAGTPERPRASRAAAAVTADSIRAERALLATAHAALRDGDAGAALAILDTHADRFPRGALAEERTAARVRALCAAGRRTDAAAIRDHFLKRWPRSVHADRVRGDCER